MTQPDYHDLTRLIMTQRTDCLHQKSFPPSYLVCMLAWRQALRSKTFVLHLRTFVQVRRLTPKVFSPFLFGLYGGLAPSPTRQGEKTFGVRLRSYTHYIATPPFLIFLACLIAWLHLLVFYERLVPTRLASRIVWFFL